MRDTAAAFTNCGRLPMIVRIRADTARIMVCGMGRKLLGDVIGLATGVAKHVAWYLAHRMEGRPRPRSER